MDMLVESTDVPSGMTYRQAARKSVASCVSDFAAKGVRPDSFLVSLGIKRGTDGAKVRELAAGFRDAEREWGVHLIGGDTNEAKELVIDCAMFGYTGRVVQRSGAKLGEVLVVTGMFGFTSAGLKILQSGARASRGFRARALASVLRPAPNLELGLALGGYLTSSVDSSDGLARSLHLLSKASGVGFELTSLPYGEGVREFAKANDVSAMDLVLAGGEEYVIVGTLKASRLAKAKAAARKAGGHLIAIGKATDIRKGIVLRAGGKSISIEDRGWTHLG